MKLQNSYIVHKSDDFHQMTDYLRNKLIEEYEFNLNSAITVKVKFINKINIELRNQSKTILMIR